MRGKAECLASTTGASTGNWTVLGVLGGVRGSSDVGEGDLRTLRSTMAWRTWSMASWVGETSAALLGCCGKTTSSSRVS